MKSLNVSLALVAVLTGIFCFIGSESVAQVRRVSGNQTSPLPSCLNGQVITYNTATNKWDTCADNGISGSITDSQIAFGTGINTIGGDNDLIWDSSTNLLINTGYNYQGPPAAMFNSAIQFLLTGNSANVVGTLGSYLGTNFVSQKDDFAMAIQSTALAHGVNGAAFGSESNGYIAGPNGEGFGYASYIEVLPGISGNKALGFYAYSTALGEGASLIVNYSFYSGEQGGRGNSAYPFWADERGVYRIKSDNTFNSVYQAIPALYNPLFSVKYTPGEPRYERCIPGCQWNSNVAQYGTEAGGDGVLRGIELIGSGLKFNPSLVAPASSGTRYLCISTTGIITSSVSACSGT